MQRSIEGQYVVIQGFDEEGAKSYYPDLPAEVNTLSDFDAEHGYWVKVKPAGELAGTQGNSGNWRSRCIPPEFLRVPPSSTWVNFYGLTSLPVGTPVQAVDPDGVVCGAAVVHATGKYGLLACYGDDPTTPEDEGAEAGDVIRLVVDGEELGTGTWTAHGGRQWVPLGAVRLWRVWLPLLVRD